tara:strand:- start:3472 stop:4629 length:1158 start_codon:yes stop_codon:yes gene_type:complete
VKILYVAVDTRIPGSHGGSVHVQELCHALGQRGHDVHILAPKGVSGLPTNDRDGIIQDGSVRVHRLAKPTRYFEWTAVRHIRRLILELRPDVLVERFYTFGGAGILAANLEGIPAVLEVNSPARPVDRLWRDRLDRLTIIRPIHRWRCRILRGCNGIYATSRYLLPPEMQNTVTLVTNGVDVTRFKPGPVEREKGPLKCVYISSFKSWHGAEDLVRAVALCRSRGVDICVTCIGSGPTWKSATRLAKRLGVGEDIKFLGAIPFDKVPKHLAEAEIGLAPFSPSKFSPLELGWFWSPIKLFEYLAAGLGIITINLKELRDLLPDSVARFYKAGATEELSMLLERFSSNPAEVVLLRQKARELAESDYTWLHQAATVEQLLERVQAK